MAPQVQEHHTNSRFKRRVRDVSPVVSERGKRGASTGLSNASSISAASEAETSSEFTRINDEDNKSLSDSLTKRERRLESLTKGLQPLSSVPSTR